MNIHPAHLGEGIVGPISADYDSVKTALQRAMDGEMCRSTAWHFKRHSDCTLAISYRYSRAYNSDTGKGSMNEKDAECGANLICEYARSKSFDSVYLWCDSVFSKTRRETNTSWTEGGVAPYAYFKVVSCDARWLTMVGDQYWRFWITMETVLGATSRGLICRRHVRLDSEFLAHIFKTFEKSQRSVADGFKLRPETVLSGLATALDMQILDPNPLYELSDRQDLKHWAVEWLSSHHARSSEISLIVSLFDHGLDTSIYDRSWKGFASLYYGKQSQRSNRAMGWKAIISHTGRNAWKELIHDILCVSNSRAETLGRHDAVSLQVEKLKREGENMKGHVICLRRMTQVWHVDGIEKVVKVLNRGLQNPVAANYLKDALSTVTCRGELGESDGLSRVIVDVVDFEKLCFA